MMATDFEYRHQTLLHQLIVGVAFLTYLVQPDDIVWQLVMARASPHALERLLFIAATCFVALGAAICTWARATPREDRATGSLPARRPRRSIGEMIYAVGLGSFAPLSGFLILVVGEAVRLIRLEWREKDDSTGLHPISLKTSGKMEAAERSGREPEWRNAFRQEFVKWGVLATMIVFVITLKDRVAEVLLVASFVLGVLLNAPFFDRV